MKAERDNKAALRRRTRQTMPLSYEEYRIIMALRRLIIDPRYGGIRITVADGCITEIVIEERWRCASPVYLEGEENAGEAVGAT